MKQSSRSQRPKVVLSFAMTVDGKISAPAGTHCVVPSRAGKRHLYEIRARGDALLVEHDTAGSVGGTMGIPAADLREERVAAGRPPVPIRVIVSEGGRFDPKWKVFSNSDSLLILCTGKEIPDRVARQFPPFVQILEFPGGRIPMHGLLEMLRSIWGVKTLVCEGGPTLLKSLLVADAVDDIQLTLAPLIFGGSRSVSMTDLPGEFLPGERRFRLKSLKGDAGEAFLHYQRKS